MHKPASFSLGLLRRLLVATDRCLSMLVEAMHETKSLGPVEGN